MNREQMISKTIKDLGVTPALLGYAFLREGIAQAMDDMSVVHNITSVLYPTIARKFNTTSSRVERAIRHAVARAWSISMSPEQFDVFGFSVEVNGKPTNGMFIATVADYLLLTEKVGDE